MATSIKIDDSLKQRMQHLAEFRQRSVHWLMCEAIKDYVAREEARESFKQEASDSWPHFQETGQHLTQQETQTWLIMAWGDKQAQKVPPCHEWL